MKATMQAGRPSRPHFESLLQVGASSIQTADPYLKVYCGLHGRDVPTAPDKPVFRLKAPPWNIHRVTIVARNEAY